MGPVSILLDGIVGLGFIVLFMKVQRLLDNPVTHLIEAVGRRSLYIFCIHTVELTAVPWYLMVQKYAAAPHQRPLAAVCRLAGQHFPPV